MKTATKATAGVGGILAVGALVGQLSGAVQVGDVVARLLPDDAVASEAEMAHEITRLEQRLDKHIENSNAGVRYRNAWREKLEQQTGMKIEVEE